MLRPLTEHDLPILLTIEHATQPFPWTEDIFRHCLGAHGSQAWGYLTDRQLSAFVFFSLSPPGESHLLNLCVTPTYQRQGIASCLLQHAISIATAADAKVMLLEVRRSNQAALALYQREGFHQIGERKHYYRGPAGGEDAIVCAMELGLT